MTSFASLKIQNLEQKTTSQASMTTMDAFRNLLATQKRTKTPFNYHWKGSSIGYDGGVDLGAQEGKDLYQKIVFILTFY